MTPNHGDRGHAAWSASASARNWACPGSFRLCATIADQPESLPAAWGTACHQLSEKCLRQEKDAVEFVGTVEHTKEHAIEVDEELAETAQVYIDYVRGLIGTAAWVKLEERFTLDALNPPFEAGGTADATAYHPTPGVLEVVDLKGGRGVMVEVVENKQLRTYALGALLAHPGLDVDTVMVTIVQPRIHHKAGRIRSESFHVADLVDWTGDLLDAMQKAAAPDAPLVAGSHCTSTFCKAAGVCPALQQKAMEAAQAWFTPEGEVELKHNTPDRLMPEDIALILDNADTIQGWLNAVRAYAHAQAESGVVIPGYALYPKQARKKWKDEAETAEALELAGLTPDDIYAEPKLRTPAQIIKKLGKNAKAIDALWSAESSGTNLARADKSSRKPVAPSVHQHFEAIGD
jgi:hypothetical protein